MATIFTIIVVVLMVLAISGLVVGVSNDAVNFLNSAVGSKAAPRKVILLVASIGIIIGALSSNGMMEVARSGVFYPQAFTFSDVMMLFLGVMFANVILLDLFNTFGLPTSTTVSLVLGLLGASMAVATARIAGSPDLALSDMSQFINSGKVLVIISAILVSVVVAFVCGSILMFFTRVLFTFRYKKVFSRFGALWCGIAFTAICYFILYKGLGSAGFMSPELLVDISNNIFVSLLLTWLSCSALMFILQHLFKINILKATILAGTFALALAFAGNDLVNFIGVPIAGYDSYKIALANGGDTNMLMGALNEPVQAKFWFLLAAGSIMVLTLWFSKKAQSVSETEINLAKQDEGSERFGSTLFSRSVVRLSLGLNKSFSNLMPDKLLRAIDKRFIPSRDNNPDKAHFDLIRATLNLTVSAILISMATSFSLPLSTTYVTFMVGMGSSLADRAWGRESAVYRITGVLTVISGWFVTALVAFVLAFGITMALIYGGTIAIILVTALCAYMMFRSSVVHSIKVKKEANTKQRISSEDASDDAVSRCLREINDTMDSVTRIYKDTLMAVFEENRKKLRSLLKEANDIFYAARERKYEMLPILQKIKRDNYEDSGHYYVQVVDYMSEVSKALLHIVRPCFEHIDNNHEGFTKDQIADLIKIGDEVTTVNIKIDHMLRNNDFTDIDLIMTLRDRLFVEIEEAQKNQLRRIKNHASSTKSSMLYLNILNETKTMMLQSRNLLKSQKYFLHGNINEV